MRLLIQRVAHSQVTVDKKVVGKIDKGALVLFGVKQGDTHESIPYLAEKFIHLRMFSDDEGKMNLSLKDLGLGALIVSQFTLYADCSKGRRPSFVGAAHHEIAEKLYEKFILEVEKHLKKVEKGIFGAKMQIELVNDGPVTFIVDSK